MSTGPSIHSENFPRIRLFVRGTGILLSLAFVTFASAWGEDDEATVIADIIAQIEDSCEYGVDRAPVSYEDELAVGAFYDSGEKRYQVQGEFDVIAMDSEAVDAHISYSITDVIGLEKDPKDGDSLLFYAPLTPFLVMVNSLVYESDDEDDDTTGDVELSIEMDFATDRHMVVLWEGEGSPITNQIVTVTFSSPVTGQSPFVKQSRNGTVSMLCSNLDGVFVYAEAPSGIYFDGFLDFTAGKGNLCLSLDSHGGSVCTY